jgi:hypothetical protein
LLPAKFVSPPYAAMMEWDPTAKPEIVSAALPFVSAAEPIGPEPDPKVSTKETIPVGVPLAELVTVAVKVTD